MNSNNPEPSGNAATPPSRRQTKKLRLNYITKMFQLRYGLWLATIGSFCFFLMGVLMYLSIQHSIQNAPQAAVIKEAIGNLLTPRELLLTYEIALPALILTVFLFAFGFVGTHRIAGPLYTMKRHMNQVRQRKIRGWIRLRRDDELQDVAASLNALLGDWWDFEDDLSQSLASIETHLQQGLTQNANDEIRLLQAKVLARQTVEDLNKKSRD